MELVGRSNSEELVSQQVGLLELSRAGEIVDLNSLGHTNKKLLSGFLASLRTEQGRYALLVTRN